MVTIYRYKNIYTNKSYIGQTVTGKERRQVLGYEHCPKFYDVIKCYMDDMHLSEIKILNKCFDYSTLERIKDQNLADIVEEYYIEKFDTIKNGYNSIEGGKQTYNEIKTGKTISSKLKLNKIKDVIKPVIDPMTYKIEILKKYKDKDRVKTYKNLNKYLNILGNKHANEIFPIIENIIHNKTFQVNTDYKLEQKSNCVVFIRFTQK